MVVELARLVRDFADGIMSADAKGPIAINQRSKSPFAAGIGPHSESAAIQLVMSELTARYPSVYPAFETGVPYPGAVRQKCDLCLGVKPNWDWAVEVKLLRLLGDNGQPNDNMLMHILSPYPAHRSALTDCAKLVRSGLYGRKAIVIYGFESEQWPLEPGIRAFEALARSLYALGERFEARFAGLIHPIHASGGVFGWVLPTPSSASSLVPA